MKCDAILFFLGLPSLYLIFTFYIAYSRGREFDRKWAGFGWKSDLSRRLRAWRIGAVAVLVFMITFLIGPWCVGLYTEIVHSLNPGVERFIDVVTGIILVPSIFMAVTGSMKCMMAADRFGPSE